jgi:hypothetical protein
MAGGCASVKQLTQQGRVPEAWKALCAKSDHGASESTAGTAEDRKAMREALARGSRATLAGAVLTKQAMSERLGEAVFPSDVLVLQLRLTTTRAYGAGLDVHVYLALRGGAWHEADHERLWSVAGVRQPYPMTQDLRYSTAGLLGDVAIGAVTLGSVDLKLRGTDSWTGMRPGSKGDGTEQQVAALQLFDAMSRKECSSAGAVCERTVVLAPAIGPRTSGEGVSLAEGPGPERLSADALVIEVNYLPDSTTFPCGFRDQLTILLPPGATLGQRLGALFAKGPLPLFPGKP